MIEHNWEFSTSGKVRRLTLDMLSNHAKKLTTVSTKEINHALTYIPNITSEYFHEFITDWKAIAVNPNTTSQQLTYMNVNLTKFCRATRDDDGRLKMISPEQTAVVGELWCEMTAHPNLSKSAFTALLTTRAKDNNVGQNPQIREYHLHEWFDFNVHTPFEAGLGVPVEIFDSFFNRFNAVTPYLIDACLKKIFIDSNVASSPYRKYMAILATIKNQTVITPTLEKCIKWLDDIISASIGENQHSSSTYFVTPTIIELLSNHPNSPQKQVSILRHKLLQLTGDSAYLDSESKELFVF